MLNALFLNMYSVVPKRNFPVIILNKKSVLQYSSGIVPKHSSAITQNLLFNSSAIPRIMNVWLLNQKLYWGLFMKKNVIAGVIPINKRIIPSHALFFIFEKRLGRDLNSGLCLERAEYLTGLYYRGMM